MNRYNEREYAEKIKEKGFQSKYYKYELTLLAKYYTIIGKKNKKETEDELILFCEEYIENYTKEKCYKIIDQAIKRGTNKKYKLINIDGISFTKDEIKYIKELVEDNDYRKILLTLLFNFKLNEKIYDFVPKKEKKKKKNEDETNIKVRDKDDIEEEEGYYFGRTKKRYKELINISGINKERKLNINNIIFELNKKKIVEPKCSGYIRLHFIEEIKKKGKDIGETHIKVKDFNNIGLVFDYINKELQTQKCSVCKTVFKYRSKKPPKYCKECAKKVNIENTNNKKKRVKK